MPLDSHIIAHREAIKAAAARHGVRSVRVFGSRARGDADPLSDVDLLVEAGPDRSFFSPGGLVADLEDLLDCPVEVVTEKALHPALREQVLREAQPL